MEHTRPSASLAASVMDDPVLHWQQTTLQANALFERGEPGRALRFYQQALDLLLQQFGAWPQAEDALGALLVSYLNVAEAQRHCGLDDAAAATLSSVHHSLLRMIERAELPLRFRDAARHQLRLSYAALQRFVTLNGAHPAVQRWLRGACVCAACADRLQISGAAADGSQPTLH